MSKKQSIAFFEEISKNQQLAKEVEKVVDGKNSDEAKAKELLSLAKKHNFIFTQEDAKNAQGVLKTKLSPEKMLEVSGGKLNLKSSLMAAAMLLGLGAGGATLHSMEASAMKRTLSGKRGKSDQILPSFNEVISDLSNRAAQGQSTTNGNQPQPTTTGTSNSRQNGTPPSNDQGEAQSDSQQTTRRTPRSRPRTTSGDEQHATRSRKEKKVWPHMKRTVEAAQRFKIGTGIYMRMLAIIRACSGRGHLPNGDWPAAPVAQSGDRRVGNPCRFCEHPLAAAGQDVSCSNEGCIYHWVYDHDMGSKMHGLQGGTSGTRHYARWGLLPALILDSRNTYINSTGKQGIGRKRKLTIETPAEAWAVWQLIAGHNNDWVDVRTMMAAHNVAQTIQDEVIRLLEESYGNLVLGNESFIELGSEVQQLVEGYANDWQQVRTTLKQRGYNADLAIEQLKHSY